MNNKLMVLLVMSAMMTVTTPAFSCSTCLVDRAADSGVVASAEAALGSAVSGAIAAMKAAQLSFMSLESAQQHADKAKSQTLDRAIAEASIDAKAKARFQENAANISDQTADNGQACHSADMAIKLSAAGKTKQFNAYLLSSAQKERTLNTVSSSASVLKTFKDHDKYCSHYDKLKGRCSVEAPEKDQDLELNAHNIFTPNADITYSQVQLAAATDYVNGVINPFPSAELQQGLEKSEQGKAYVVAKRVEQQRLSLAYESMNQILASRIGSKSPNGAIALSQTGNDHKFANKVNTTQWSSEIALTNNREALLRENVKQAAFRNYMDYKTYLQMEHLEGILAASLAIQAKDDILPILNAQMSSAKKASGIAAR